MICDFQQIPTDNGGNVRDCDARHFSRNCSLRAGVTYNCLFLVLETSGTQFFFSSNFLDERTIIAQTVFAGILMDLH